MFQNTGRFRRERPERKENTNKLNTPAQREETSEFRIRTVLENDAIDLKYGFERVKDHLERVGFLINMHASEILDEDKRLISAVVYYFIQDDGGRFKVSYPYMPYFYILTSRELMQEVTQFLSKKFSGTIGKIEHVVKEDLDLSNHLNGLKQHYLKLSFFNQTDLIKVRKQIFPVVRKNREKEKGNTFYTEMLKMSLNEESSGSAHTKANTDHMENIIDMREHDVPYHVRVSIDLKIFCGSWYSIKCKANSSEAPTITLRSDIIDRPEPIVLAFDIETTKLPLKFPDANSDQIMMISYMIDGQGYLITNREILSSDIEDFEYTPKPEFEGRFTIFNESNEMALIQKFFDHITEAKPHIISTYNGDFFDWPFVEARAASYDLDMKQEIGFFKGKDGFYTSRPSMHMDCFCWVKRDSYLPVGSHGLKAVAKAKLRYDPVELDPEEMCPLASSDPQTLSNYSVSDAVATYYLYMKYVHPFIFALCTIIPCEPDEVLRKGSGTLCEALLMVEAFHGNIIFPNKQETELNKLTSDGHVLHEETYVGGHVEALESGVFRADIPCRFRLEPEAIDTLIKQIPKTLEHAIVIEEGVPLDCVVNLEEVMDDIKSKLVSLKENPMRLERPLIYHLDVGAMYPNIILTNRLQPCAIVNETICASCSFNKPGATCQRNMTWMWRGEYMPASRNEYNRIQLQLETEKFPPKFPGGPQRAFHQLSKEEQSELEKKRLSKYCHKVYKKTKITRMEERVTTTCQKENSFYVDTVRAFRDRRYEYKGLSKNAKNEVIEAIKGGDATEIKLAKNKEVLYDSLQLAHKCILNSFYGYVMRRGARWYSMEMAGIVCYTGANIIMRAREIIEKVGRPLELDTDGIWCILPVSFPETFTVVTNHEKKKKFTVSYPNAVLNAMVKEYFTNDQYHELVDPVTLKYEQRSENTIFFEVDGPYKAMVLPASKEEGKKLKKRYAVFNFDGSLAELKGFEVKRRGELQLIKNFQSSVFEAFLKGNTLEECYASVARVADYWLNVLYSRGQEMSDSELFELIAENRSMSRKLEDYGTQKSTSISTAKRLAEFLGDQMVKDAGLACKYVICKKPESAPVTERAIPLAIFQTDEGMQRHYLKKWLKDSSLGEINIRDLLDWNYYIERLSGTIQKIITIPAAMQGVVNPVPRVRHPAWLHKKISEKNDVFKQRRIDDMFSKVPKPQSVRNDPGTMEVNDIEDAITSNNQEMRRPTTATVTKRKRSNNEFEDVDLALSWKEVLGNPPPKEDVDAWILFHKRKWRYQALQRTSGDAQRTKRMKASNAVVRTGISSMGQFLQKSQRSLMINPWQILQISQTNSPGEYRLWALVGSELHLVKLILPRIFYVNISKPTNKDEDDHFKKCSRILPRSEKVHNLYMYTVPESIYVKHGKNIFIDQTDPNIKGVYELEVPPLFRAFLLIGCVCKVVTGFNNTSDTFPLDKLDIVSIGKQPYLPKDSIKHIYLYQHRAMQGTRQMFGLFLTPIKRAIIIVLDSVKTNLMPDMENLYRAERIVKTEKNPDTELLPPEKIEFQIRFETKKDEVYKLIQKEINNYKVEKKGPTLLALQTFDDLHSLQTSMPGILDFPTTQIHIQDVEDLYNNIEWQKVGARAIIRHYLNCGRVLELMTEQSRYFHLPIGNMPADPALFGSDLFFARNLVKQNHILWCSPLERPDLGGVQENDARLLAESQEVSSEICNNSNWYSSFCVELDIDSLAINTLLQANHVTDIEGTSASTAFDAKNNLEDIVGGNTTGSYDETSRCTETFRVLRTMASTWMRDISLYRNVFADFQVIHFYRWLRSPQALLYDPALLKTLQNLMKKLFMQLVAEFKRLGCTIVYANFNKIIVCLKKHVASDAVANIEFIIASIKNKELFHSIEINYSQYWEVLVWLDPANFAGIQAKIMNEDEETKNKNDDLVDDDENQEEKSDEDDSVVVMNWNITELLPEAMGCRNSFNTIIAGYVNAVYLKLKEHNYEGSTIALSQPNVGLIAHEEVAEFAKELIKTEVSQTLFQITEKINDRFQKNESTKESPALDFINAICHVLSLNQTVAETVDQLKSNLLRLIGVGEFSEEVIWKDRTVSYVIPQLICKSCNHCRDVDLGRDHHRSENSWLCPLCNTPYDNSEIEDFLLDTITKKLIAYNLQDLQCNKCGQIKLENLLKYCQCAGEFRCIISKEELIKLLKKFLQLGETFDMPLLKETVQKILNLNI